MPPDGSSTSAHSRNEIEIDVGDLLSIRFTGLASIALRADFRKPDGSPRLPEFGLSPLEDHPDIDLLYLEPEPEISAAQFADVDALFRESDFVCVNCLLSEETHHLVNRERLALMKSTAFLINTARGPIVDQTALTEALREGRIAGAGIDVFEQEPPDADDPLLALDNVIVTPHALCWTDQLFAGSGAADVRAVMAVMEGRIPSGIVNRDVVDRPGWKARLAEYAQRFGGG